MDTETKGLNYVIDKYSDLSGTDILIFTERIPCAGCVLDIAKFDKNFRNATINVFDTKGKLLIPN